jgi:hypothetical protein
LGGFFIANPGKAVVPEGLICGTDKEDLIRWRRKFPSPIVDVWRLRRGRLERVDLFAKQHIPLRRPSAASLLDDEETDDGEEGGNEESPFLYIGSHQSQLYIQESVRLRTEADAVTAEDRVGLAVAAYPRVTWRPYLVRSAARPFYLPFTNFYLCKSVPRQFSIWIRQSYKQYTYGSGSSDPFLEKLTGSLELELSGYTRIFSEKKMAKKLRFL